jgi:MFS family permease
VTVPLAVAALGRPPIWLLLVVGVLLGACTAPFNAARTACLRQVVPQEKLATAVAVNMARGQAAYLLGPVLGGFLFTLSPSYPFWLDAVSFVVSALSILGIRASLRIDNPEPRSRWWRQLTVGLKFLWEQGYLRNAVLVSAALELVFEGVYLTLVVTRTQQGTSGVVIGAITASATGGAFVGTLVAGRVRKLLSPGRLLLVTGVACAVLVPVMAFVHDAVWLAALLGGCMLAISLSNIVIATVRVQRTPDHLQGRMNSALALLAMSTTPLGSALAGVLLDHLSATAAILVFGAMLAVLAAALTRITT